MLPFWSKGFFRESLEEDEKADIPEGGEAGVVDGVEDGDQGPALRCSGEDGAIVRIVEEVSECFETSSVPAWRLDGHGSDDLLLLGFSSSLAHVDSLAYSELLGTASMALTLHHCC